MATHGNSEAKSLFNKRIAKEGRWSQRVALCELLKAAGVSDRLAWKVTALLMPPLDGSPCEIQATPELEELCDKFRDKLGEIPELPKTPSGSTNFRATKDVKAPKIEEMAKEIVELPEKTDKNWRSLMKQVDRGAQGGNILEKMWWIYENYGSFPDEIPATEVPSRGTLMHLKHLNSSPLNYGKFLETCIAKLIPDRKQLEQTNKMTDDNQEIYDAFDEFERNLEGEPEAA